MPDVNQYAPNYYEDDEDDEDDIDFDDYDEFDEENDTYPDGIR